MWNDYEIFDCNVKPINVYSVAKIDPLNCFLYCNDEAFKQFTVKLLSANHGLVLEI